MYTPMQRAALCCQTRGSPMMYVYMCMYMYVCMYVCIRQCNVHHSRGSPMMYVYMCICMYVYANATCSTLLPKIIFTYDVGMYICMCMYVCIRQCFIQISIAEYKLYTYIYIYTYILCVYASISACMYVCMYVCMDTRSPQPQQVYIHICMRTYTHTMYACTHA
jgi:hypothetical protein